MARLHVAVYWGSLLSVVVLMSLAECRWVSSVYGLPLRLYLALVLGQPLQMRYHCLLRWHSCLSNGVEYVLCSFIVNFIIILLLVNIRVEGAFHGFVFVNHCLRAPFIRKHVLLLILSRSMYGILG